MLSRTIDLLDWNSLINNTTKISNLLMVPNLEVSHKPVTQESANWVERSLLGNWGHFKHKNTPLNLKTRPTLDSAHTFFKDVSRSETVFVSMVISWKSYRCIESTVRVATLVN